MTSTIPRRELSTGQAVVLSAAGTAMLVVGGIGAWGTYTNAVSAFHRQATAAGVVAAGEGLTLILALIMLGRTMLNMSSPSIVRGGMWVAPLSASCIGVAIANDAREAAVYAVTPLAMSGAAEGLGLVARSIVVYRTGLDAEVMRRNADTARQLAFHRAVADGHPGEWRRKLAVRRYWRLAKHVGVGDTELGAGLVDVQRVRVRDGADAALAGMYGGLTDRTSVSPGEPVRSASATDVLRARFADMDPADAIRFAHDARPDAPPAELAAILGTYDVHVDPVAVALVLGQQPAEYTVERPDAPAHQQVTALPAVNLQGAVEEAAAALGEDASPRAIAEHLEQNRRLVVDEPYIRTALSRAAKKPQPETPAQPMEGGYA
ncbi:conjugal transfer protein [Streptomyces sp. NBC_01235]|uniref:conjugal transfer protein n=1 Tax=Streptomyces sp. NBC_01235 TaxID=2903788 RepID=UPI002E0D937A|nr:conjugal transfer protein [Streptomyces sp. NBC_01235]